MDLINEIEMKKEELEKERKCIETIYDPEPDKIKEYLEWKKPIER